MRKEGGEGPYTHLVLVVDDENSPSTNYDSLYASLDGMKDDDNDDLSHVLLQRYILVGRSHARLP